MTKELTPKEKAMIFLNKNNVRVYSIGNAKIPINWNLSNKQINEALDICLFEQRKEFEKEKTYLLREIEKLTRYETERVKDALREQARQIFNDIESLGNSPEHLCNQHEKWCDCYKAMKRKWCR